MARVRLMDPNEANYAVDCMDDACAGMEGYLSLSDGGNNLTRTQALRRIKKHRAQYPTHSLSWSALGGVK